MRPNGGAIPSISSQEPSMIEMEAVGDGKGYFVKRPNAPDPISNPPHYNQGRIECIEFIEDQLLPFHEASALKYIVRARHKGFEVQDLKKAIWYLARKVELLEQENSG